MKYTRYLNTELKERYAELQAEAIGELSLRDEVVLYQSILSDAVQKHSKVHEELSKETDLKKRAGLAALLDVYQSQVLHVGDKVKDMVLAAAKLENDERTMVIGLMDGFANALCNTFEAVIADKFRYVPDADVDEVRQAIRGEARERMATLMSTINQGSIIDMASGMPADMEAQMMDSMTAPRRTA